MLVDEGAEKKKNDDQAAPAEPHPGAAGSVLPGLLDVPGRFAAAGAEGDGTPEQDEEPTLIGAALRSIAEEGLALQHLAESFLPVSRQEVALAEDQLRHVGQPRTRKPELLT
eukprot:g14680.t1